MNTRVNNFTRTLFLAILTILVACTEIDKKTVATDSTIEVTFVEETGPEETFVANIAIDGMHCEMGCGGRIAKELNQLEGVKNTDIDFFGEGETNFALVEFDANTVSEQEMIKVVNDLSSGNYNVSAVEVKHIVKSEESAEEEDDASAFNPRVDYKLPNIFSAFSRLF